MKKLFDTKISIFFYLILAILFTLVLSLLFFSIPGGNKDIILMIVGALTVSIANMTKSFGETESREISELKESRDSCMAENSVLTKRIDDMQNQLTTLQTMIIEKLSNLQK